MCRVFVTGLMFSLVSVPARAQEVASKFEELGNVLKAGDSIFITDQNGGVVTGTVTSLTAASLELVFSGGYRQQWNPAGVREIRRRDPLSNGIAIGAGVGLGAGLAFGIPLGELIENETGGGAEATVTMAAIGLAAGMALGAMADAAAKGPVLFRSADGRTAIRVVPILSNSAKGLQVAVRF
jgi:hypothetical protein